VVLGVKLVVAENTVQLARQNARSSVSLNGFKEWRLRYSECDGVDGQESGTAQNTDRSHITEHTLAEVGSAWALRVVLAADVSTSDDRVSVDISVEGVDETIKRASRPTNR
jgi:hypothetical protein